ncbi:MAG TPA: radical SAM protein, partial [Gammaproteobacteria bacterium]|nr:radical SAM protein [Gammaproteobacteria bacterium]
MSEHELRSRWDIEQDVDALLDAEQGTIYGDAPIRVALVYPSPYRVGMSSLGYQTIYRRLNALTDVTCERAFLPDEPEDYRRTRTPLFTFESKTPVDSADIIAFSVAYETEILGVLECLDLAGIPIRAEDRGEGWPLILFGGPLTFSNPLPIAPFSDAIVMGEGEQLVDVVVERWKEASDRATFLADLAKLPGMYVPHIHGEALRMVAQADDTVLPAYSAIITPNTELSNMHLVENARGCHRGCTFCVMRRTTNGGMRTVSPEAVLATIPDHAERVGLVGAATSDHPQILEILESIVESGREVGLSSLRADR